MFSKTTQFSFCSIAYRFSPLRLSEIIERVANCGYSAIEIWGGHLDTEPVKATQQALLTHDMQVSMISPYFDFTGSQAQWNSSLHHGETMIRLAKLLNCPAIRCFTGNVGSGQASPAQWANAVSGMSKLAGLAANAGLTLCIENHENTLADTSSKTLQLLQDIGKTNVGLVFDAHNLWEIEGQRMFSAFHTLYPHIRNIHLKNASNRQTGQSTFAEVHDPSSALTEIRYINAGDVAYDKIFTETIQREFNGYLSVEWFGPHIEQAAAHELEYLQRYFQVPGIEPKGKVGT